MDKKYPIENACFLVGGHESQSHCRTRVNLQGGLAECVKTCKNKSLNTRVTSEGISSLYSFVVAYVA
jgi:hypothetical protein